MQELPHGLHIQDDAHDIGKAKRNIDKRISNDYRRV